MGQFAEGISFLDEAMVSVGAREVSPIAVGDAYCTVIDGCQELFDIARVREWTTALSSWCDAQPQLVLYHGRCLVHRAEILAMHGEWPSALVELDRALERIANPIDAGALGAAFYLRAELFRLRGEHDEAADQYRQANERGREPQPGLALMRLAQGRTDAAVASIRRVLDEAQDPISRSRVLGAYVEIVLATGDTPGALKAAEELEGFAAELGMPMLSAMAATATGRVQLTAGEPRDALSTLRRAWRGWHSLDIPFEAARVRLLIAQACRALGDGESADMELDAARTVFDQLGAVPDRGLLESPTEPADATGLSTRELEVLRLLATGATNRSIAGDLMISEKTVASHLSHIFTKLQLESRAAATAYAYEHGLMKR
ncbi:MAG: LuxR C-terminal-related transcriptional regulator [Actinobacteria bacterium]|nr:LuxR C-terminal-related transcriptional regulator [Actinomycetota bacterium]